MSWWLDDDGVGRYYGDRDQKPRHWIGLCLCHDGDRYSHDGSYTQQFVCFMRRTWEQRCVCRLIGTTLAGVTGHMQDNRDRDRYRWALITDDFAMYAQCLLGRTPIPRSLEETRELRCPLRSDWFRNAELRAVVLC